MNKDEITTSLLILVIILLLMDLCATKENLCLCNGAQCGCRNQGKSDTHRRIQACDIPDHMVGVL